MSNHEETVKRYQSLLLEEIPTEWVDGVWDGNFCEAVASTDVLKQLITRPKQLSQVVHVTRAWIETRNDSQSSVTDDLNASSIGFWTVLFDAGVSHKCLLAVIYCLLDQSKTSFNDRICAVYCSQLYLTLLQVPGTTAYKTFHPMLFQKALDVFNLYPETVGSIQRRRSSSIVDKKRRKRRRTEEFEEEEEEVWSDKEDETRRPMSTGGDNVIKMEIRQCVKDLLGVLHSYSLRDQEVTRHQVISSVLRLTRVDISSGSHKKLDLTNISFSDSSDLTLHCLVWACLDALSTSRHGSVEKIITEIFHQLLPLITMVTNEGGICTSPLSLSQSFTLPSQHAVTFVKHVVTRCGSSSLHPLKTLVQHICSRTPDRAEYRSRMSGVVCVLLGMFNDEDYANLMEWLYKFSRNTKVSYRVFAMEVINEMFLTSLSCRSNTSLPPQLKYRLTYPYLIKIVLSRCSDRSPSVRSKALACLSTAASSDDNRELTSAISRAVFNFTHVDPLLMETPQAGSSHQSESVIIAMLRRRTADNKVAVRKSAVQTLESLILLRRGHLEWEDISVIHERCMDPALSVRKQAMISLTSLVQEYQDSEYERLHRLWLDGVLPAVMDREVGAKDKCLSILEDVILNGILEKTRGVENEDQFVWRLLTIIAEEERMDLRRCLHLALQQWSKDSKITSRTLTIITSHTAIQQHQNAAWMLLSKISALNQLVDTKFLLDNWKSYGTVTMSTTNDSILVSILTIIGNMAKKLGKIAIGDVKDQILELLSSFKLPVSVIGSAINTLTLSCYTLSNSRDMYQSTLSKWMIPLLNSCEQYIHSVLLNESHDKSPDNHIDEDKLVPYLFTLGEISQLIPGQISSHTCLLVQSLLLSTSEAPKSEETDTHFTSFSSQLSTIQSLSLTPKLRAHAYITLGKLCLQDEELAKNCLLLMSCDLQHTKYPAIRNNIIIIMSDLAVRYSAKVDPYIPSISVCLKDESLLVRKQTLTLLAHLLQEDYIKSKGAMFFHFLSTLNDIQLKKLSEFCLVHLLLSRSPNIFYQNFIECIFHFNDYRKHRVYNQFKQSEKERVLFSLAGSDNANQRYELYIFLLSHMADEHRFQLTAKLCHEVLGSVVDEIIPLDEDSVPIIKDTLMILSCKEIKLSSLRRPAQEDEGDVLGVAMVTAQTKIISQIVKKNVMENIVPIVIATKHLFERERSPLIKDLLTCLKELMQDYRNEIKEILTGDPQLAEEIQFDLRKFDEEQKRLLTEKPQTPNTDTPLGQMVSPLIPSSGHSVLTPVGKSRGPVSSSRVFSSPKLRTTDRDPSERVPPSIWKIKVDISQTVNSPLLKAQTAKRKIPPTTTAPDQAVTSPVLETPTDSHSSISMQTPRTSGVNIPLKTPVLLTPRVNLMKMALLTSTKKSMTRGQSTLHSDQNIVTQDGGIERAASTPEGAAECISFNISSILPPSPIPRTSSVQCYMRTCSKSKSSNQVDILMLSPEQRPEKLSKWNIK